MRTQDIIAAKRDGREITDEELARIVLGFCSGDVPDYQMSAFLMAAAIRGLTLRETVALTRAMVESGDVLDFSRLTGAKVDKHSSGGVGDKTTLVVVPVLAACGLKVPKMSGRGLGFTGGTLDKLESIPGLTTALGVERFVRQVADIGAAMAGHTPEIVPADKRIYALRDVTATADSIPLIAASIMSKKIACSADVILIDVKVGSGAFVRSPREAGELARTLIAAGRAFDRRTAVAVTDMSQPLGNAVGNALEVTEAIETLRGGGPPDLRRLCVELCAIILGIVGLRDGRRECIREAERVIDTGAAFGMFRRIVEAQGGDLRAIDDTSRLPHASLLVEVPSPSSGVVVGMDCRAVGLAACALGAGRERKEDEIDPAVGLVVRKKIGDAVEAGEPLAQIHTNDASRVPAAMRLLADSYTIGEAARPVKLIRHVIK